MYLQVETASQANEDTHRIKLVCIIYVETLEEHTSVVSVSLCVAGVMMSANKLRNVILCSVCSIYHL